MKKTTMDIYKAMFPSLLIYLVIVAAFSQIFEMMGLGTDAFMTPGANPAMPMPEFHFGTMAVVSLLVHIIYFIAVGLVGYGLILMIYRMARYGTDPEFVDAFYFFNAKAGSTIGTYIIEKILTAVFFCLLVVPGIIFSLAMVPLGAVIGIDEIRGRDGAMTPKRILANHQGPQGHDFRPHGHRRRHCHGFRRGFRRGRCGIGHDRGRVDEGVECREHGHLRPHQLRRRGGHYPGAGGARRIR